MPDTLIQPYLFFGGRCEEALAFYAAALGATVDFKMLYKDSPEPVKPGMIPPGFEGKVMYATVRVGGSVFMASDGNAVGGKFEGFLLSLAVASEAEAKKAFAALSAGGRVNMPLGKTFWSPCFGMVVDKFGVGWMVTVPAPR